MLDCFILGDNISSAIPIVPVCNDNFTNWLNSQSERIQNIVNINRFSAEPNTYCLVTATDGLLESVLLGIENNDDYCAFGVLPKILPNGTYFIKSANFSPKQLDRAAIGWGMGSYQYTKYKKPKVINSKLLLDVNYNHSLINSIISNVFLTRDLINTPACDMAPNNLVIVAEGIAKEFSGSCKIIAGNELKTGFPAVYAVGRGSENKPVLIDLLLGDVDNINAPKIVLVGKGVCFDSGGLDLKGSAHMQNMKTDMGGAAHALALARLIMQEKLPINLRVIIPVVENLISGDSVKPGDIIISRKGLSIEVTNTDAEGRLILADALALACEWKPELILDFATLTGAARIALGNEIIALFTPDDNLAVNIKQFMDEEQEPIWRLPLHQPYFKCFKSDVADFINASISDKNPSGGAITAALFLQQFIDPEITWAHFDMLACNAVSKPAKPEGGEAKCLKGLLNYFKNRLEKK